MHGDCCQVQYLVSHILISDLVQLFNYGIECRDMLDLVGVVESLEQTDLLNLIQSRFLNEMSAYYIFFQVVDIGVSLYF